MEGLARVMIWGLYSAPGGGGASIRLGVAEAYKDILLPLTCRHPTCVLCCVLPVHAHRRP
jgi:hypothetical protein